MSTPEQLIRYARIGGILSFCLETAQAWDDNYSVEDDATVLPIVLPIVGVVMLACVIGCCVQGGKCGCFNKDKDKKLPANMQGNSLGRAERQTDVKVISEKRLQQRPYMQMPSQPPSYNQLHGSNNRSYIGGRPSNYSRPSTRTTNLSANHSTRISPMASHVTKPQPNRGSNGTQVAPGNRATNHRQQTTSRSKSLHHQPSDNRWGPGVI